MSDIGGYWDVWQNKWCNGTGVVCWLSVLLGKVGDMSHVIIQEWWLSVWGEPYTNRVNSSYASFFIHLVNIV